MFFLLTGLPIFVSDFPLIQIEDVSWIANNVANFTDVSNSLRSAGQWGCTTSGLTPGLVLRILSGQAAGLDAKERMRRTSAPTELK